MKKVDTFTSLKTVDECDQQMDAVTATLACITPRGA